jgi:pimeloyl-ACP methyl ester carboxylesterase
MLGGNGNGRSQSFPYATRFAHLSQGPVAYFDEDAGASAGDPLLFIHGLVGDFTHFEHVAPHFARAGHRVAGLDLPGCGISHKPLSRHSIDSYARLVLDWMDHLGLRRATLVGHSAGGMVSARAALLAPERVERLVLLSSAGLRRYSKPLQWIARAVMRPRLLHMSLERLAMPMLDQVFVERNEYTAKFIADSLNRPIYPTLPEMAKVFHDLAPDLVSSEILDKASRLSMPVLVLWGDSDRLIHADGIAELASCLPKATFKSLTRCGHMPMIERPADVVEALRAFMTAFMSPSAPSHRALSSIKSSAESSDQMAA